MITERLMGHGDWSVTLDSGTPRWVKDRVRASGLGHVVVTPTWADLGSMDDDDALALSRFTGIVRRWGEEPFTVGGIGVNAWLGEDGTRGRSTGGTTKTDTFANWATFLTPDYLGTGIRSTISGNFTHTYDATTFRALLDVLVARFNAAYRVTNDFKLDVGTYDDLFRSDPVALIVRHREDSGRDFNVRGITGDLQLSRDIEDWARRVVYWWDDGGSPSSILQTGGVADADVPFRGPTGDPAFVDIIVNDSQTDNSTDATALSLAQWGRFTGVRNELTLSSTEYDIGQNVQVGDMVWAFDPDRGILDTSNEVIYRGATIHPAAIRCVGYTWPVRDRMGVWLRRWVKPDTSWVVEWTDLTPFVVFEGGDSTVEVGAKPRPLS